MNIRADSKRMIDNELMMLIVDQLIRLSSSMEEKKVLNLLHEAADHSLR